MNQYEENLFLSDINGYQAPLLMGYIAALRGFVPPKAVNEAFRYCDLGCGDGKTVLALASVYATGDFVGIEADEGLVNAATQAAEQLGLKNVRFICAELSDLSSLDCLSFHFMAITDTYGHSDDESVKKLHTFAASHLNDGGLLYLQYLALPGQANLVPLWQFLQKMVSKEAEESDLDRSKRALILLTKLAKRGLGFLENNRSAAKVVRKYIAGTEGNDVQAARFLKDVIGRDFYPRHFDQVFDPLQACDLNFVGRCEFSLNDLEVCIAPAQIPTLRALEGVKERELLKDYLLNTQARHDLFVKKGEQNSEQASLWMSEKFALLSRKPKPAIQKVIAGAAGNRVSMQGKVFNAVIDAADDSVLALKSVNGWNDEPARHMRAVNRLLASGQYFLCRDDVQAEQLFPVNQISLSAFNLWQLKQSYQSLSETKLVSQKTAGVAIILDVIETLVLYFAISTGWDGCCQQVLSEVKTARVSSRYRKLGELTEEKIEDVISMLREGQKSINLVKLGIYECG